MNNEKRTALIRFADRYSILAALVYSLKCRIPTKYSEFRLFLLLLWFHFLLSYDSQSSAMFRLDFGLLFWKKIPFKSVLGYTQTERKCVWSAFNVNESLFSLFPFAFYVIITIRFWFFFSKIKSNQLFDHIINLNHTHYTVEKGSSKNVCFEEKLF